MGDRHEATPHPDGGYGITHQALSPKLHGGWHTMWWTGPDVDRPTVNSSTNVTAAAVTFPTAAAAVDAFTAAVPDVDVAAPQLDLLDGGDQP